MRQCGATKKIQDLFDRHGPDASLPGYLRDHIYGGTGCAGCREFYESYRDVFGLIRGELDRISRKETSPADHIEKKNNGHLASRFFPLASAAALVLMITLGGVKGYGLYERQRIIKEETSLFVDALMEEALLDGNDDFVSSLPSGWFDDI